MRDTGQLFFIVSNDTKLSPTLIGELLRPLAANDQIGVTQNAVVSRPVRVGNPRSALSKTPLRLGTELIHKQIPFAVFFGFGAGVHVDAHELNRRCSADDGPGW